MKLMRNLLLLQVLIIALYSCGNAQDWRKITPMISTKAEVEALLGPAEGAFSAIYQLKEGSLFLEYSSGPCRPERKGGWNVPANLVVTIRFSPKNKRGIASLKLDPKKFRKVIDQHVIGVIYYINDDDGITYEVQAGRVNSVEYGPAKKYEHLYCGDPE